MTSYVTCEVQGCSEPLVTYRRSNGTLVTLGYCRPHWSSRSSRVAVGSSYKDSGGYVIIKTARGFEREHRIIMEKILGRSLVEGETVHHKNGIRDDNHPDNLELWVGPVRRGARASDLTCRHCHKRWSED